MTGGQEGVHRHLPACRYVQRSLLRRAHELQHVRNRTVGGSMHISETIQEMGWLWLNSWNSPSTFVRGR